MNGECQRHRDVMATYLYEDPPPHWQDHRDTCPSCRKQWESLVEGQILLTPLLRTPDELWEREVTAFLKSRPPQIVHRPPRLAWALVTAASILLVLGSISLVTQIDWSPPTFTPHIASSPSSDGTSSGEFHSIISLANLERLEKGDHFLSPSPETSPLPPQTNWLTVKGLQTLQRGWGK